MDVLDVMRDRSNVCNYLDIPLQHGSTAMLKAMRRGITREKTEELIDAIRQKVPGIALRTTLISGFPGETEQDFEEMMGFVERSRFDRLGIFTYSHEENTHAFSMTDDVSDAVKQQRADAVMELQSGISYELNQAKIGNTYKTLFDRVEGDYFIGRTEFDSPDVDNEVLINAEKDYIRTARAKGLPEKVVYLKHALRNALIPIVTGLGSFLSVFFAGSLLLEKIFQLDGMGLLGFNSLLSRDYNVLMGLVFIQSLLMLVGNIISDIAYVIVDPRIDFS